MINIAVCDDSEFDIEQLRMLIDKYSKEKSIHFSISTFLKPEALLFEIQDGYIADLFILDVSMPGRNGFELAQEIRKHSENAVIIFLTSHDDLATEGYKSKALRYILKLNIEKDIDEAFETAIKEISKAKEKTVIVKHYSDLKKVPYSEIISVSRVSRQLVITTGAYGTLSDNRGITEFFNALNDKRFLFIDRSCFVNIDYISQIEGYNLKLTDNTSLPISRRSLQSVKQTLLEQWGF